MPAISGHVPPQMVCCLAAFLEFCYLVRCDCITESTLKAINVTLAQFHTKCTILEETGIRIDFNLPRQHSLKHYQRNIQLFGAPNGLCSSITKSKHIKVMKEPWCHSNHFEALGQVLITNQHINKLSASQVDFASCGLLSNVPLLDPNVDPFGNPDAAPVPGPKILNVITLAVTCGSYNLLVLFICTSNLIQRLDILYNWKC